MAMATEAASETLCFFQELEDGQSSKKKKNMIISKVIVSVNFSHAVSLFWIF